MGVWRIKDSAEIPSPLKKFAVIIPAHNEEKIIENALHSIINVEYPSSLFDIYTIADNCTDNTAEISRKMNVQCLERFDPEHRGKGHALKWFLKYAIENNFSHDVFLIIDADSVVDKNILKVMNKKFCEGTLALNARYEILSPESSVTASIAFLGFLLRNLRYKGLSLLGGSAQFLGNGMAFTFDVIKKNGWCATSITEDREQWAILHLNGVRVEFVDDVCVSAIMPGTFEDFRVPRARWDIGSFAVNKKYIVPFFKIFLEKRDLASFFTFLEILTPPFTYYFSLNIMFLLVDLFIRSDHLTFFPDLLWTANNLLLFISVILSLLSTKKNFRLYKNLLFYIPVFVPWRIWNLIRGYLLSSRSEWIRSKRG